MAHKIGIIYASVDGQTEKICNKIYQHFLKKNKEVKLYRIEEFDIPILEFQTLVIGASIRYGHHNKQISEFIVQNKTALNKISTAFFSVNLVARKEDKNTANTNPYLIKFLKKTKWKPNLIEVFAGKLDYSVYTFFDKIMIKLIMKMTDGPTKSDKPIEFTDWKKVDGFSIKILKEYNAS